MSAVAQQDFVLALRDLHLARDYGRLRTLLADTLERIAPSASQLYIDEDGDHTTCEWSKSQEAPFALPPQQRTRAVSDAADIVELIYGDDVVGRVLFDEPVDQESRAQLEDYLLHWTTAFVNRRLSDHATDSLDQYSASLQALQEGVVLFQEADAEAIGARFLGLFSKAFSTDIGAVYVLDEIGEDSTTLRLEHVTGLPEHILEDLVDKNGDWWPQSLLRGNLTWIEREEDGSFGPLDPDRISPALQNLIAAPLANHGVVCGVVLAFNVPSVSGVKTKLESGRRLAELGAALFHRLQLEEETVVARLLEDQLEIASTLQARLVPTDAPQSTRHEFAWSSHPALYVGGDYVDLYEDDDEIVAAIADVSGHGVNSALLMTSYRAGSRGKSHVQSPASLLAEMNDIVHGEVGDTGMFLTAVLARLQRVTGHVRVASAGHNPVLIWRARTESFEMIDSSGPPLGFIPGMSYEDHEAELEKGDVFFLYTDGVVEAAPPGSDDMFEMDRLMTAIRETVDQGPEAVLARVLADVEAHAGVGMREDDVSILVARFD